MIVESLVNPRLSQSNYQQIRQLITAHFSLQELKTLCFDIGVEFDDLGGEGLSEKARELVTFLQRRDRIPELLQILINERPGVVWPGGMALDITCPYRGLFAFREEDASNFFGREDVANRLAALVAQQSFLAVVGSSGSGKSSVVFAGLLPRMRRQDNLLVANFRPGINPFSGLAAALLIHLEPDLSETDRLLETRKLAEALQFGELSLNDVIVRTLEKVNKSRYLLIADQFEELYTLCLNPEIRQRFLDTILEVAGRGQRAEKELTLSPSNFCFVLTLRADFMSQALAYPPLVEALQDSDLKLGPMPPEALRLAIEEPAHRAGVRFEAGLVERILDDVGTEGSNLPLLEFALTLLWEWQNRQRQLTHIAYEQIGQVKGALARHANQVFSNLNATEQDQVQHLFIQMVHPGAGTEDTRRLAQREDLGDADWALVQRLADARLLVTNQNEVGRETVEVIHEALIQHWGRLRSWMESNRDFRVWQERLRVAMQQWEANRRDRDSLLRGASLAEAEEWLSQRKTDLGATERAFISEGTTLQLRNRRLKTVAFFGLAVITMIMGLLANVANQNEAIAVSERATAFAAVTIIAQQQATTVAMGTKGAIQQDELSRQKSLADARVLANESLRLSDRDYSLSVIKAFEAAEIVYSNNEVVSEEVYSALYEALSIAERRGILTGHTRRINFAAYSRDAKYILTASEDTTARLWSDTGVPLAVLKGHTNRVNTAAFSPDGKYILTASNDSTARLWGINGELITILEGHTAGVNSAIFLPDGTQILTISEDNSARIWDENGNLLVIFEGHTGGVRSAAFSPDGTRILTASSDGTARLWDQSGNAFVIFEGHTGGVRSAVFSPDGTRILTASDDSTARLWDVRGNPIEIFEGHTDSVNSALFSPDGTQILTAATWDVTARLWDIYGNPLVNFEGHELGVSSAVFSPDGSRVLTVGTVDSLNSSGDHTVHIWNLDGNQVGSFKSPEWVTVSAPDGGTEEVAVFPFAIFSSDGRRILATNGLEVNILDENFDLATKLLTNLNRLSFASFPPRGSGILVVTRENVYLLDENGNVLAIFEGHTSAVSAAVFSPDGNRILTASWDETARLWDENGNLLAVFEGHTGGVNSAVFSPDGNRILTVSWDETARLWDENGTVLAWI
jgi:WD40 repeat protein